MAFNISNFLKSSRGGGNTSGLPRRQEARAASLARLVPASGPSPRPWRRQVDSKSPVSHIVVQSVVFIYVTDSGVYL